MMKFMFLAVTCVATAIFLRQWFVAGMNEDPYRFREPRQR
jgi:hypothetical protein